MTKLITPIRPNHSNTLSEIDTIASKFMNKANKPITTRLDSTEKKVPVDGLMCRNPNLTKIADVPKLKDAERANRIPSISDSS